MATDPLTGEITNNLRIALYKHLLPQIIEQDQAAGNVGPSVFWGDPDPFWGSEDINAVWGAIGLQPIIQTLFYVIERMEGEELDVLESLDDIISPDLAPASLLKDIAASFGFRLGEGLSEAAQRNVVRGLFHAYKSLGQRIAFRVFFRMAGFEILRVFPLFKKDIFEANQDYSRVQFETTSVTGSVIGPAATQVFKTTIAEVPIKPGTLRITDGSVVLRDQPTSFTPDGLFLSQIGSIIGPGDETGTINYATGELTLDFGAPAAGAVAADFEQVVEEWPYHAARIDIEVILNPGGLPVPLVNNDLVGEILDRVDEARPIHVLLRAFALVIELRDEVTPAACDSTACNESLFFQRDAVGLSPGETRFTTIDASPNPEDGLTVEEITGGTTTSLVKPFQDRGPAASLLDTLTLDFETGVIHA